jgi:1-acyl-sn-glycerol-3-phosphate acyltransferase
MTPQRSLPADSLPRPKLYTFFPPKNNRFIAAAGKRALWWDIRRKLYVTEISISDEALDRLRRLKGKRCLIAPSHSGGFEPHIVMQISKMLGEDFNYVAAMELFAQSRMHRWMLQRLGVYSVIRGAVDRPSFATTRQILADGIRRLVVFPEGEAVGQNSIVIPFQPGVIQLAFKAYEDAVKVENEPSLYCIPMAIRYFYLNDMHVEIDLSLERLEEKLAISSDARLSRYERLRQVADAVLAANERVHSVSPDGHTSMNNRISNLKERVLTQLENQLGVTHSPNKLPIDRVRALLNAIDRINEQEAAASEYDRQLVRERQNFARECYQDLWRALRFVAIYDGYVGESLTVERFMDVLGLLELEVHKRRPIRGPRKACVEVAEAIDLRDHYAAYVSDRRGTVKHVTSLLESAVRQMLDALENHCQALRLTG